MKPTIETERLVIRPWRDDDAADAVAIYGDASVVQWLTPAMDRISNVVSMHGILRKWQQESEQPSAVGHWAVEHHDTRWLVGGLALLPLPPGEQDLSIAWQLMPAAWGKGFAAEAGAALVRWALNRGDVDELFAVVPSRNARAAATACRIGMEWVGETTKYYGLLLQLYRIRHSDLIDASRGAMAAEDLLPY